MVPQYWVTVGEDRGHMRANVVVMGQWKKLPRLPFPPAGKHFNLLL